MILRLDVDTVKVFTVAGTVGLSVVQMLSLAMRSNRSFKGQKNSLFVGRYAM
jgi:hypothetical protein